MSAVDYEVEIVSIVGGMAGFPSVGRNGDHLGIGGITGRDVTDGDFGG